MTPAAPSLARAFVQGITAAGNILLNLSGLEQMDVEGAGLLVMNGARAARKNIPVAACGLPEPYRDVFHLTGLDEAIVLYDNEEDALGGRNFRKISSDYADSGTSPPAAGWARSGGLLSITDMPPEVMNINVDGRRISFPANGFGRLWDKRYRLHLNDPAIDPREIVALWRSEFPDFWPTRKSCVSLRARTHRSGNGGSAQSHPSRRSGPGNRHYGYLCRRHIFQFYVRSRDTSLPAGSPSAAFVRKVPPSFRSTPFSGPAIPSWNWAFAWARRRRKTVSGMRHSAIWPAVWEPTARSHSRIFWSIPVCSGRIGKIFNIVRRFVLLYTCPCICSKKAEVPEKTSGTGS